MFKFLLALSLIGITPAMAQTDWYILDFSTGRCIRGSPQTFISPAQEHDVLRQSGISDQIHVEKDNDGDIIYITIENTTPQGGTTTNYWFPNAAKCEAGRQTAVNLGWIPDNMKDLQ